jgi:membrane-associated phospholipid phosphatase
MPGNFSAKRFRGPADAMEVIGPTSGDALGLVEDQAALAPPAGTRGARRRRRPTGGAAAAATSPAGHGGGVAAGRGRDGGIALVVFTAGRYGRGVSLTVLDRWVLARLATLRSPGLTSAMHALSGLLGSVWTIKVLGWSSVIVLAKFRRFRHLLVAVVSLQLVSILAIALSVVVRRPRPFGVAAEGNWAGWTMPSRPVALLAGILVGMLYSLVPEGRWRQAGKWVATGLVALLAVARMYLGVDAPSDVLVGAAIGVTIPLLAFRWFVPNTVFPVRYGRGRAAHLDVGGTRGQAIRDALVDQLGLVVEEVKPFGLAGSAGSTPLRIKVTGDPRHVAVRQALRQDPPALRPLVQVWSGAVLRAAGG